MGLFAAGFSSAITAPYASAIISRTVFDVKEENKVRFVRITVLSIGFFIGVSGVRPIPVILIVQALNGLILPILVIFLILVVNDPRLIPAQFRHGHLFNALLLVVLGAVTSISLNNVDKALISTFGINHGGHLTVVLVLSVLTVIAVAAIVYWQRLSGPGNK